MSIDNFDEKQFAIVDAALKRFSHFGVSKTTMAEIADDLAISKASLYYYFPDKISLVLSVGGYIFKSLTQEIEDVLDLAVDFEKGLESWAGLRIDFGKKYYMMHIDDFHAEFNANDPKFKSIIEDIKAKELIVLSAFIDRFKSLGFLKPLDEKYTAQILMDMMLGVWVCGVHIHRKALIPSNQLFTEIKDKCNSIIKIFTDGIKRN